jgi:transposase
MTILKISSPCSERPHFGIGWGRSQESGGGVRWNHVGALTRIGQVIDVILNCMVREYRAEVVIDGDGNRYVATFPDEVAKAVQYGSSVKSLAVYMSQYQLIPYNRVQEIFADHFNLSISQGSLHNFNKEAFDKLDFFEVEAMETLKNAAVLNADETGIQIGDKNHWLHVLCTPKTTYFFPHERRGCEAIDEMGVLKDFTGVLVHDHWKPYFGYTEKHGLCNAHHLRELQWVIDFKGHKWASSMKRFLNTTNKMVIAAGGVLPEEEQKERHNRYRQIIRDGRSECPIMMPTKGSGRKKVAQTKERNLLDRLDKFEDSVLRFMKEVNVPFTNNQAEQDIRMVKVQQKVSGCFRSMNGARYFCRIRGFLLTNNKRGTSPYDALNQLFGNLPSNPAE